MRRVGRIGHTATWLAWLVWLWAGSAMGEPVVVRHAEGLSHGFLLLRAPDGAVLATGETTQNIRGSRVTSDLAFRFRDGSAYDDTTIFSQEGQFRLISDHVTAKGPSFSKARDVTIDAEHGRVTARITDEHGRVDSADEHLDLPPDVANGLIGVLLKNVPPDAPPSGWPYVLATPKPRLATMTVTAAGQETFSVGDTRHGAMHYVLKLHLGGLAGAVAPLIGKQPPDSHVWVLGGAAPLVVRAEQPFSEDTPVWRIDLTSPRWQDEPH